MKILVIGSGGREHALAWRIAQSPSATHVYAAPGNPGIAQIAECLTPTDQSPASYLAIAQRVAADLTIVGPETPLVAGVVDLFRAHGMAIVGPTADNARLEGSKIFAKEFFRQHGIPTARSVLVANSQEASAHLVDFSFPVVLKADGLAAGKGVVIANSIMEAEAALPILGDRLVIEEFLTGEEVSFIVLSDGRHFLCMEPTQDHKTIYDGDCGPNTGGMGAYSDSRILTTAETQRILDTVIQPTVHATQFTGFLYAGLMMTADGPKVLEFNVRMGDPETQALMQRLNGDFAAILMAAAGGGLSSQKMTWNPDPSVCVVLASEGYPGSSRTGDDIEGIDDAEAAGAVVFHAGTQRSGDRLVTAGGRVLGVTAAGANLAAAIRNTYRAAGRIRFPGMQYRKDIGRKGLTRYNEGDSGT
ncbi:MAG: phosphoribosylamine--glycine ligase [Bryobacteraceae bacterium]